MIDIPLRDKALRDRVTAIRSHVGVKVTFTCDGGRTVRGVIERADSGVVIVIGSGSGARHRIEPRNVVKLRVHVGGDWLTKGGESTSQQTNRIVARCCDADKREIAEAATRAGVSLTQFVLDAALSRARQSV